MVPTLVLLFCLRVQPQAPPDGWTVIKDARTLCQITVPPEWVPLGKTPGAAVFEDSTTAIAVVTSQPGQEFKPLAATLLKMFGIPKQRIFENSATRIFYQEKVSRHKEDTNAYNASVPARNGTCSCHVVVLPTIPDDVAKKIALSISPVPAKTP